jgi:hypothetical protein
LSNRPSKFTTIKKNIEIPFSFVLERLQACSPEVKPMFGCFAIYHAGKMVLILRHRKDHTHDNGVWLATSQEHHDSLKAIFPSLRSVRLLGSKKTAWQNLPAAADDFEESVTLACELILKNDPRIGKIPQSKKKKIVRKR